MFKSKRHKVKSEKPESAASGAAPPQEYDLTYYIHDRVELMHQVFSVLKSKELKAIAPLCVRDLSIDDLQELCTEELLGISSKRLCAILDGAEPPSDTDSSSESPERFETISLDSISSDEEILSESSSKKNKKHKRHHRKRRGRDEAPAVAAEATRAARAGLTVLELLELQARARAIRAQLQRHRDKSDQPEETGGRSAHSSDNEVEIKEEPAEVVEISSEDEKPRVEQLTEKLSPAKEQPQSDPQAVTKRVNDLVITVPQTRQPRKIKLNRNKVPVSLTHELTDKDAANTSSEVTDDTSKDASQSNEKSKKADSNNDKEAAKNVKQKEKQKKKIKKKKKVEEKDSDHDEITLQLSDTEKLDLLEDLDRKNFENVSSSGTEDSESSSSSSSSDDEDKGKKRNEVKRKKGNVNEDTNVSKLNENDESVKGVTDEAVDGEIPADNAVAVEIPANVKTQTQEPTDTESESTQGLSDNTKIRDEIQKSPKSVSLQDDKNEAESLVNEKNGDEKVASESPEKSIDVHTIEDIPVLEELPTAKSNDCSADIAEVKEKDNKKVPDSESSQTKAKEKDISEGEISDKSSSEIEAVDFKPEVVCISDTEETDSKKKSEKKKKKKEKKSKSKKLKKSKSDFRESADQNFFKETEQIDISDDDEPVPKVDDESRAPKIVEMEVKEEVGVSKDTAGDIKPDEVVIKCEGPSKCVLDEDYDAVYEILELSDDSSCYEVEGTVLSKEPTAEEIEALSAKIDEIEREDVVTEEEIREHERRMENVDQEDLENVSWKDRYLDSKKVKVVLTTSNIFNVLRKKNRELKKKLEESKKEDQEKEASAKKEAENKILEEGSIEQYNTLPALTKYVDPDNVAADGGNEEAGATETPETVKEMRKDAKQLLKMYKKLLKYNDMNKKKDPNKVKKKKKHKKKSKETA